MTKGIQVTWPGERGNPNYPEEIEYICGIDVDRIDRIPPITETRSVWDGRPFRYAVDTRIKHPGPGEVRLIVRYDPANPENEEIDREWPGEECWGTNTIILKQSSRWSDARRGRRRRDRWGTGGGRIYGVFADGE